MDKTPIPPRGGSSTAPPQDPQLPAVLPAKVSLQPAFGRVTVVETICYFPHGLPPTVVETRFGKVCKSDAQVWVRRFKATPQWQPLDLGWLAEENVSVTILSITNEEGRRLQTFLTDREKAELSARVIEVGMRVLTSPTEYQLISVLEVPPGESCRFRPIHAGKYIYRCLAGEARGTLNAFPE